MEKLVRNHFDRQRKSQDFSEPKITDPSFKNVCDINVIMERYQKTGMLPNFPDKKASFLDATLLPTFLEAHEIITNAKEEFSKLPAAVRKACDHKIENLEPFLNDEKNHDFLLKHGLLEIRETPKPKNSLSPEDIQNLKAALKENEGKTE